VLLDVSTSTPLSYDSTWNRLSRAATCDRLAWWPSRTTRALVDRYRVTGASCAISKTSPSMPPSSQPTPRPRFSTAAFIRVTAPPPASSTIDRVPLTRRARSDRRFALIWDDRSGDAGDSTMARAGTSKRAAHEILFPFL
jgi:hypothetical protein